MNPIEAQFLFARAVLLLALYAFLGLVALVVWFDVRGAKRTERHASDAPGAARLIVIDGAASGRAPGFSFALDHVSALGRDLDNLVVLVDATVSGHHAVVVFRDDAWWLEDLSSTNGTFLNGQRLSPDAPAIARSGDVVQVGAVRLRLVDPQLA